MGFGSVGCAEGGRATLDDLQFRGALHTGGPLAVQRQQLFGTTGIRGGGTGETVRAHHHLAGSVEAPARSGDPLRIAGGVLDPPQVRRRVPEATFTGAGRPGGVDGRADGVGCGRTVAAKEFCPRRVTIRRR